MTREEATVAVGYLVGATTGWNDEAVLVYVNEFETLGDVDALMIAVRRLVQTWDEPRRPPIATVLGEYRLELSRNQQATRRAISSVDRVVPFEDGIKIAQRAYEREVEKQGRKPDPRKIAKVFGIRR